MLSSKGFELGDLKGVIVDFEKAGDATPIQTQYSGNKT